jgi:yeast amino acid transporter
MSPGRDIEMNMLPIKEGSLAPGSSYTTREPLYDEIAPPRRIERWVDSFRRDPNQRLTPKDPLDNVAPDDDDDIEAATIGTSRRPILQRRGSSSHYYDVRWANLQTSQTYLARRLKGRHLQMIAIGGSIGTPQTLNPSPRENEGGGISESITFGGAGRVDSFTRTGRYILTERILEII